MKRVAMIIGIKPDKIAEYRELHDNIWPGVVEILSKNHVKNYSIFLHHDRLIGYLEYNGDNYEADMQAVAAAPITQEWWKHTEPLQLQLPDHQPGQWWTLIEEVFHMD